MKTKLTITIDEDLLPEFKDYAASMGESLSQVVEDTLIQAIAKKKKTKKLTFAEQWRGKFKLKKHSSQDPRWQYLAKRYSLK